VEGEEGRRVDAGECESSARSRAGDPILTYPCVTLSVTGEELTHAIDTCHWRKEV
jgi:hypothetical protein